MSDTSITPVPHIGLALSGGGHRAALFGLGALLYVIDVGKGPELACISSVSGGSLANAAVGQVGDVRTMSGPDLRVKIRPLVRACSTGGSVFASPWTWAYLAVAAVIVIAAAVLSIVLAEVGPIVIIWVVTLLLLAWWLKKRGWVAERSFDRALFRGARLDAIHTGVDHVICAADLQTAEAVYFSGRFLHSYRLGWGRPGSVKLARAVQSSAALPGAFHPRRLRTTGLDFEHPEVVPRMLLTDGGVYDNMATEWPLRLAARSVEGNVPSPPPQVCDELIVVNSSAGEGVRRRTSVDIPIVGELTELLAVKDVLYDQTTAVRRRLLDLRFRTAGNLVGTLVQIDRSPLALPRQFAAGDDDRAQRARAALAHLATISDEEWATDTAANKAVKTALSKIPADRAARLLRHAYTLTMVNAHVLLGYDLLPIPPLDNLRALSG